MTLLVPCVLDALSTDADAIRRAIQTLSPGQVSAVLGTGDLKVTTSGGMVSVLAAGKGLAAGTQNATTQGYASVANDAAVSQTHAAADGTNPRNDLVGVKIEDAFYSGSNKQATPVIVTGTPAASPVDPGVPANYLPCARVRVNAGSGTLGTITDLRSFVFQTILPGGNGWFVRDSTNAFNNLALTDAGALTVRGALTTSTTPYHAEVHASAGQVISNATVTIVVFDVVDGDPNSNFSTGTNKYTCPVAGRYRVSAAVTWLTPGAPVNPLGVSVYKNAVQARVGSQISPASGAVTPVLVVNGIIACAASDLLDIRVTQSAGGAYNTSGGLAFTWACFEYVGP